MWGAPPIAQAASSDFPRCGLGAAACPGCRAAAAAGGPGKAL